MNILALVRAGTYAALFIALHFIYLPGRLLTWSGVIRPEANGAPQIAGMIVGGVGTVIALWCIFTFAFVGKGTSAPFDPPQRLVIRGPYRFVRNPMYIGAGARTCGPGSLLRIDISRHLRRLFLLAAHIFVVAYEEPTLRRTFGQEYDAYCARVRRWWPAAVQ